MTGTFSEKQIDLTFQLGKGSFGGSGFNQVTFTDLRVEATIEKAGLPSPGGTAIVRVHGMPLSAINELSVAGLLWDNRDNKMLVKAGDNQSGLSEVFNGDIVEAYPDFEQPMSPFVVTAVPGVGLQLKPVDPVSFDGPVAGATALQKIVQAAGLTVENNGVDGQLVNPYFPGTVWEQVLRCVKALDCFAYYDATEKKIAIWPKNGSRNTSDIRVISAETGMIGYPKFQQNQILVRTYLDTSLRYGSKFRVKSGLTAADGEWNITIMTFHLASQMPDGPWEVLVRGNREVGLGATTPSAGAS